MTSPLDGKVSGFGLAADTLQEFISGEPGDVDVGTGTVPTLRKLVVDIRDSALGAVGEQIGDLQTAVQQTGQLKAEAQAAATTALNAQSVAEGLSNRWPTKELGIANTADQRYFSTPSPVAGEAGIVYQRTGATAVEQYRAFSAARVAALDAAVKPSETIIDDALWAVVDTKGNAPLLIDAAGNVRTTTLSPKKLQMQGGAIEDYGSIDFVWAIADASGNVALAVRTDGTVHASGLAVPVAPVNEWTELSIGLDDSIIHIGDSYTASHYTVRDKAYISQLSALSPYRHINYGVSGHDALDMQHRAIYETLTFGVTLQSSRARYAFLTSLTNDGQFRNADLTYYAENMRRLIETVRAAGAEPVVTTEFPATAAEHALLRRLAEENGCGFIDCTSHNTEVGGLVPNPFHQGHPGQRTNGVFWLPMLEYIDRMPRPTRAIKIFRRRPGFAVSAISDLLYSGRLDRAAKWKEITLGHYSITPTRAEELSQLGEYGVEWSYDLWEDEYLKLAGGGAVPVADYALLEVTLPGSASTLEAVELTLGVSAAAMVYARNFLDVAASMPGREQGATPTDATYLAKWNKPRGAWRSLGAYGGAPIVIPAADLRRSMQGNTLVLMVAGAFNLTNLKVRYKGRDQRSDLRMTARASAIGAQLIAEPLCGTSAQLATWTVTGAPPLVVPIDRPTVPRKPAVNTPVDGVAVISAANMIAKNVALPAETGSLRRFRLTVWGRTFPKAFLDPAKYPALDASQIVNRVTTPGGATITPDTYDLRTVKCEVWEGTNYPTWGGAEFFDFAALLWRPIEFVIELQPYKATSLSFRLSCPDGEVQVAKVFLQEISV